MKISKKNYKVMKETNDIYGINWESEWQSNNYFSGYYRN